MLGRMGLAGLGADARGAPYGLDASGVKIAQAWVGRNDGLPADTVGDQTDFWHVVLFGWMQPDSPFISRHIFQQNVLTPAGEDLAFPEGNLGNLVQDAWNGYEIQGMTEFAPWNQIRFSADLVDRAWRLPKMHILNGHSTPSTRLENQDDP